MRINSFSLFKKLLRNITKQDNFSSILNFDHMLL
jgi:hypothetical protein